MKRCVRLASAVMILAAGLTVSIGAAEKKCGVVEKVTGPEIIVKYSNVARPFAMGDKLHINTGAGTVNILATFPMQTVSKCRVTGGSASQVKKGMIVYFDVPPVKEEPVVVLPEEKTGIKAADDGTITDTKTGLVWLKNAGSFYGNWDEAVRFCEELEFAGFNDWHLPTKAELETLSIGAGPDEQWDFLLEGTGFVNVKDGYWTSSAKTAETRYSLSPKNGRIWDDRTHVSLWVIPVRGSVKPYDFRTFFKDNRDGTITDTRTGLIWLKNANPAGSEMKWDRASAWCENFGGAGKGWRLPSKAEIESLVEGLPRRESSWKRTLAGVGFDNVKDVYWTSSDASETAKDIRKYILELHIDYSEYSYVKTMKHSVWPVKGEYRASKNRATHFADNGPDVITDARTGLMWAKKACAAGGDWGEAVDAADGVKLGGYDDWRIATLSDIRSLVAGIPENADHRYFLHDQGFFGFGEQYWLSSEYPSNTDSAWYYDIIKGKVSTAPQSDRKSAWLVRGGKVKSPDESGAFKPKGDDILVDIRSGIMWLKNANAANGPVSLTEAKEFCTNLNNGGYRDWRLPTRDEYIAFLDGLKQFSDGRKVFIKQGFIGVQDSYWTSTPFEKREGTACFVSFKDSMAGDLFYGDAKARYCVWAVRSEPKKEE